MATEPPGGWVQLQRGGVPKVLQLIREGELLPADLETVLTLAAHTSAYYGVARLTVPRLAAAMGTASVPRVHYSLQRLFRAGLAYPVRAGRRASGWTLRPDLVTAGNDRCIRRHELVFMAAQKEARPPAPAPASAVRARHALKQHSVLAAA